MSTGTGGIGLPFPIKIENMFNELERTPEMGAAMRLGKAIAEAEAGVEEKRLFFGKMYEIKPDDTKFDAGVGMWTVAVMLEAPMAPPQKIMAVRQMARNPNTTVEMLEEWITWVYTKKRVPQELLDFLAQDFRRDPRLSEKVIELLGPAPEGTTI